MKKIILFAFSNIKKSKGQTFSFLIMILLAMAMMTAGAVTYVDCEKNFERRFTELNAEDGMIIVQNAGYDKAMQEEVKASDKVKKYEMKDVLMSLVSFPFADGKQTLHGVIWSPATEKTMGKTQIVKKADTTYDNPIYLPLLLESGGGYQVGDSFELTVGERKYSYKIQGFFENMYMGSTSLPVIGFYVDNNEYKQISEDAKHLLDSKMLSMQMANRDDAKEFVSNLYSKYSEKCGDKAIISRIYYDGCLSGRTFMSKIMATMVVAFALIIVVISLIVIRFRILNNIEEDIKSIGAMKAMGYTSKNLIAAYTLQFVLVALGGIVLGIGLAQVILPLLAAALEAQSGMVWTMKFDIGLVAVLVLIVLLVVTLTVCVTARRIRRLTAINALRNGFSAHNFKHNYFPLVRTKGSVNWVIGLKNMVAHLNQNIMIGIIVAVLTFITLFVYSLYYNMAIDNTSFVDTIAGEAPTVMISLDVEKTEDNFIHELEEDTRVRKTLFWSDVTTNYKDVNVLTRVCNDYKKCDTNICYEGRNPEHENEVAIGGKLAEEIGKKIGDEIPLKIGESEQTYLITGLTQTGNNMGYDAELTIEGIKQIIPAWRNEGINVYLKNESECKSYIKEIRKKYPEQIKEAASVKDILDAQMGAYENIATMLTVIILIMTCLIITMILYLVIKTMIIKNKKGLGIQKALGYTTWQLMKQMGLSLAPTFVIGAFCGVILGTFASNAMFSMMLKNVGVMRMNLIIIDWQFGLIGLGLVVYSFVIALLISVRIRKISAYSLMSE